jgi:hypothetical protein
MPTEQVGVGVGPTGLGHQFSDGIFAMNSQKGPSRSSCDAEISIFLSFHSKQDSKALDVALLVCGEKSYSFQEFSFLAG